MTRILSKRRSTQKRSFLLLELVISLGLITLCLFPLLKPHIYMRKAEKEQLIQMQLEHAAQTAFCEIKQRLYEYYFSWDELNNGISETLGPVSLMVGKGKTVDYQCHYKICPYATTSKPSLLKKGMVIGIEMTFTSGSKEKEYKRTLYLEQEIEKKA